MLLLILAVAPEAEASEPNYQVTQETPFYMASKEGLEVAGTIATNTVFTPSRITNNYLIIEASKNFYYIPLKNAILTDQPSTFEKHIKGKYATKVRATQQVSYRTKAGESLGTLNKGQVVTLHMTNKGRGVIELFGKRVYVNLAEFQHINQITPNRLISYEEMEYHLKVFSYLYPELTKLVEFGNSVEGRSLYALTVGTGPKEILMDGSMHAREYMTTNVLLEMIDEYITSYTTKTKYGKYDMGALLNQVRITFVPMMNPDGVTLVQRGTGAVKNGKAVAKWNGNTSIKRWKANMRGVDLNRNFEGGWAGAKTSEAPSFKNYKGTAVFSEPESRALRKFVGQHNFANYISYHSSGQVIYYYHKQTGQQLKRDLALAKKISSVTGYSIMAPIQGLKGSGASADWFIKTYKKPGITIEIAPYVGESVVPFSHWSRVWKQNRTIGLLAATEALSR